MRFLKEDPWERLRKLREQVPNLLFQMLLRGANAVGYTNYPDNVVREFVKESANSGIDVFRIFDSLNWLEGMQLAIEAVGETGKIAEASICYTGDIHDPRRTKYDLNYYVMMAKELEKAGAHILAIKDRAGLLKPYAAYDLISALKEAVDIPIHLHTHDTSGNGIATYLKAAEAGVDIVDVAISSMSGFTSQPSLNALVAAIEGHERQPDLHLENMGKLSYYWEDVRQYYQEFDSAMVASSTEVYQHEMPGGQYSNLQQQAKAIGLGKRWEEVKKCTKRSTNFKHIGATMPGTVMKIVVSEGDPVKKGEHLMVTEAMKMETTIQAPKDGKIARIIVAEKDSIVAGDLLIVLE